METANDEGSLNRRVILILFATIGVCSIIFLTSVVCDGIEADQVEVTFEDGITVVYIDKSGPGPAYPEVKCTSSPSFIDDSFYVSAVPTKAEYGEIYLNGLYYGTEGGDVELAHYPNGVHFEIFRTDYSIVFDKNGGNGNNIESKTNLKNGSSYSIPEVSYSTDWKEAIVWNDNEDGTGNNYLPGDYTIDLAFLRNHYSLSNVLVLYPKWVPIEYTIIFNPNGGNGNDPNSISIKIGDSDVSIPTIEYTKIGHSANVWCANSNGEGLTVAPGGRTIDSATLSGLSIDTNNIAILYPKWIPIDYSIVFNSNGGSNTVPATIIRNIGQSFTVTGIQSTRTGYNPVIWNTQSDGAGIPFSPQDYDLTGDLIQICDNDHKLTLYAQWEKKQYIIGYEKGEGEGTPPDSQTVRIEDSVMIPGVNVTRFGYSASVWNTDITGTGNDFSSSVTIDETFINTYFPTTDSIALYPKWVERTYRIDFDKNGGEGTEPDPIQFTINSDLTVPLVSITKSMYESIGWNMTSNGSGHHIDPGTVIVHDFISDHFGTGGQITLYPEWKKSVYTIEFMGEYLVTPLSNLDKCTLDSQFEIPAPEYHRDGFKMVMWNTSNLGIGASFSFGTYVLDVDTITNLFTDYKMILYPVWEPIDYRISLTTEYGTIEDDRWTFDNGVYSLGYTIESDDVRIPDPVSDDRFHMFTGWDGLGDSATVSKGSFGNVSGRAIWEEKEFVLKITVNGKTMDQSFTISGELPEAECEDGFRFVGWYYIDENGNETEFTSMSQMTENMSLYAVFEPTKDDPVMMVVLVAALVSVFAIVMFVSFRR